MRKSKLCSVLPIVLLCAVLIPSTSFSNTYTFTPAVADVIDLDHYYYYGWKINNASSTAIASELLMTAHMEPFDDRTMEPLEDRGYGAIR